MLYAALLLHGLAGRWAINVQAVPPGNQPDCIAGESTQADPAPSTMQITGPDGKPLPPGVEPEIRKALETRGEQAPPETNAAADDAGILVSGIRQRGAVSGNIAPERVFGAADLKAFGANDVGSLLDSVAPQSLGRSTSGGAAVLINGRRVSSIAEIASYPADVIERVEVLPEAAALSYGFSAGQKLINVITFARYRSASLESRTGVPTRGGAPSYDWTAQLFRVDGDSRFNAVAKVIEQSALQYGRRGFERLPDRTLLPRSKTLSIRPSIAGSWGGAHYGADLQYDSNDSRSLLGPSAAGAVVLNTANQTAQGGIKLDRRMGQFSWSVLSRLRLDSARTDLSDSAADGTTNRTSYREWGGDVEFLANGPLFHVASGQAYGSARLSIAHEEALSSASSFGQRSRYVRTKAALFWSLDLPIAGSCGGAIGCLFGHVSTQQMFRTDGRSISDYNLGVNWSPSRALNVSATFAEEGALPPLRLLAQPTFRSPGALVYDAVRGELATVDIFSGGTPDLRASSTQRMTQEVFYRPLPDVDFVISGNFSDIRTRRPFLNIASTSALLQAAYPERFRRDGAGRLLAIDASPVNAITAVSTTLRFGLSLSRPLGGSAFKQQVITRSVPSGGDIASAFPPGTVVIMADEGSATDKAFTSSESRLYFAINYTLRVRDRISLPDGTELDLLHYGPTDGNFGPSRNEVQVQAGIYRKGLGAVIDGSYQDARVAAGSTADIAGTVGGARIAPAVIVNLKLFSNLEELSSRPLFINARVSIAIDNLFDSVEPAAFAAGPEQGQALPFLLRPLGRVISIDLRKAW